MNPRTAQIERKTSETEISIELCIDGQGRAQVDTGIGFLDHLLTSLACHGRFDLELKCQGDLYIDDHHSVEDCAIVFGRALDRTLGDRKGIRRFGSAYAPLDEALARAVVDLSGRPCAVVDLGLTRETLGKLSTENIAHVIQSLAMTSNSTIHVDVLRGTNDHHRAEAAFKALALALRQAVARDGVDIPSTKGVI